MKHRVEIYFILASAYDEPIHCFMKSCTPDVTLTGQGFMCPVEVARALGQVVTRAIISGAHLDAEISVNRT